MKNIANNVLNFFEKILPEKTGEEPRIAQVQMSMDILDFLSSNDRYFISHAPVGIGKSYAALVPSVFYMKNKVGRIIYATHSLNLQSQLKYNELQELKSLGLIDKYLVAKGLTNYICKDKVENLNTPLRDRLLEVIDDLREGDRVEVERKIGTIDNSVWNNISLDSGSKCKYCAHYKDCPTRKHREKYNDLRHKVVVTNHNQLIQSIINKINGQDIIIDCHIGNNIIIIDEAHYFEDAAMKQLSKSITLDELYRCSDKVKEKREEFRVYIKALELEIEKHSSGDHIRLKNGMLEIIRKIDEILHNKMISDISARRSSYELIEKAKEVTGRILAKNHQSWFDQEEKSLITVEHGYRKYIKKIMEELARGNRIILTSGSLEVNNSFDHLYLALGGKPKKLRAKSYATIFDLEKQAIVYIPKQDVVPRPPKSVVGDEFEEYCKAQYKEVKKLISITKGRTLILCTSHNQVDYIYNLLKDDLNVRLLKQGEGSNEFLTEEFRNDEESVLIGTGAFLSGVSIAGNSLVSVILCRLPFPVPEDPFIELVSNGFNDSEVFEYIQFPYMMIKLQQAFGRLIRTKSDFGCFTILDPRACDANYADGILNWFKQQSLIVTRNREDVKKFIDDKIGGFSIEYPEYSREKINIPDLSKRIEKENIVQESKEKRVPRKIGCLTEEQIDYYMALREKAKLPKNTPRKIKRLSKDPYEFFKECIDVAQRFDGVNEVVESFPYLNERQEDNLKRRYRFENATKSSEVLILSK